MGLDQLKKQLLVMLYLLPLTLGLFLLLDSKANITGAFAGTPAEYSASNQGLLLIVLAGVIYKMISIGDKGYQVVADYGTPGLRREAEKARRSHVVSRDISHVIGELERGNLEVGKGTKHLEGTGVSYVRGPKARVFYLVRGNIIHIVAESGKENEQRVIDALRNSYRLRHS